MTTMTLKELAEEILCLTDDEQAMPAGVWPPKGCPAATVVLVTGIGAGDFGPVILTGKNPNPAKETT